MHVWSVRHAARWKYAGPKKVAKNRHLCTIAQLCRAISSQPRHVLTIGKKLLKQQYVLKMSPQYGEHRLTNGWDRSGSLSTPANFNGFRVLAALLHGSQVGLVSVRQTLRRWTEGANYVRQGDHHVGHWPTFLDYLYFLHGCYLLGPTCLQKAEFFSKRDELAVKWPISGYAMFIAHFASKNRGNFPCATDLICEGL